MAISPMEQHFLRGNTTVNAASQVQQQYIPTCKNRVDIPEEEMHWLFIPQDPQELHTELLYPFLAGQIILNGSIDATECPAGGLRADGYANACGMAITQPLVNQLQNRFDTAILQSWEDSSVPPVMLKQMIRYESQFWPGKWGQDHFGLGHITYSGAYTALSWRPNLLKQVCGSANCDDRIDSTEIFLLLGLMDASCPNCPYKIDFDKAQRSVPLLAEVVYGHCEQTAQVVYNATQTRSSLIVDYPTIWKLTLMNYNVGPNCVFDSVKNAYKVAKGPITWYDIVTYTKSKDCKRGIYYANTITENFYNYQP
jgi:hypothetical protein